MAERVDGNTGREVEVLAVLQVPEVRALALDEDGRRARVGGHHVGSVLANHLAAGRVLGGVGVGELSGSIGTAGSSGTGAGEATGGRHINGGDPAEGGAEGHGDGWAGGRTERRDRAGWDGMERDGGCKREEAQPVREGKGRYGRRDRVEEDPRLGRRISGFAETNGDGDEIDRDGIDRDEKTTSTTTTITTTIKA